jgi:hypothetical protein
VSAKENFCVKLIKKAIDNDNITKWIQLGVSVKHDSVIETEDYLRINTMKLGIVYTYDKTTKQTTIESYSYIVP